MRIDYQDEVTRPTPDTTASDSGEPETTLAGVQSRRRFLRRSTLGIAGIGLTALAGGCGWGGDDEDDDGDEPGVEEDSGLEEGAEDPGEDPGVDEETGVEEEVVGEDEDEGE